MKLRPSSVAICVVVALLLLASTRAQQATVNVPQVELGEPSSPVRTQFTRTGGLLGDIECDRNGAIYLQPQFVAGADTKAQAASEIVRINSDGTINKFSAAGATASDHAAYVVGHAVDRDGRVFLLTMRPGPASHLTILQLAPDSSYVSKTDLDRELKPSLFAVLPNGEFLTGGTAAEEGKDPSTRNSVLWLFGPDGTFHREFFSAAATSKSKDKNQAPTQSNLAGMRIGDDDNIYVLRPGSPANVDVLDESGSPVRTLRLETPPHTAFSGFFAVAGGRIVVAYSSSEQKVGPPSSTRIFRVYDAQTGIPQVDYVATFAGIPACVDNNDLVLLTTGKDGTLSVGRSSMR